MNLTLCLEHEQNYLETRRCSEDRCHGRLVSHQEECSRLGDIQDERSQEKDPQEGGRPNGTSMLHVGKQTDGQRIDQRQGGSRDGRDRLYLWISNP